MQTHISITKIKLSDKKLICLNEISLNQSINLSPLLIDENYNLLDNYKEYFQYLRCKANIVPVVISSALENFYLDNRYIEAA